MTAKRKSPKRVAATRKGVKKAASKKQPLVAKTPKPVAKKKQALKRSKPNLVTKPTARQLLAFAASGKTPGGCKLPGQPPIYGVPCEWCRKNGGTCL